MTLFERLKCFYYEKRRNHWYRPYKNCSLPFPYWSDKRATFEWVYYDKENKEFETQSELYEALGDVCMTGFTYHYKCLLYSRSRGETRGTYKIDISHGHNFNEIVRAVYSCPETFEIPDEYLHEYSKQELRFLKRVQNYLKIIGLKDDRNSEDLEKIGEKLIAIFNKDKKSIGDKFKELYYEKQEKKLRKKEQLARYENTKAILYSDCRYMHIEKESVLKAMLNKTKDYRVFRYCGSRIGEKYFLLDEEENYHALIEFTEEKQILFKDLTEDMVNFKVYGDKSFKEYKEKLLKQFKEDDNLYEEKFNENTPVLYAKFKIVEKF